MSYVEYDSNNSGGSWWLTDDNWRALEAAGWKVVWIGLGCRYDQNKTVVGDDGMPELVEREGFGSGEVDNDGQRRWLGALARCAYRAGLNLRDAAEEWERVTGLDATDAGCACCGQPHSFTEYDDSGECIASGPHAEYSASW